MPKRLTDEERAEREAAKVAEKERRKALKAAERAEAKELAQSLGSKIWEEYEYAFFKRYNTLPIRNAMTNSLCGRIAQRLGKDAPEIAAFYVTVNDPTWERMYHPIGWLLRNAETIAILWTKSERTRQSVSKAEKTSHILGQMERIEKGEL